MRGEKAFCRDGSCTRTDSDTTVGVTVFSCPRNETTLICEELKRHKRRADLQMSKVPRCRARLRGHLVVVGDVDSGQK